MKGTVIILGLLVTLGEASIRGVIRYGRAEEPLGWERTGKALNLTFIEGITSTILVDFCQIADCGDTTGARGLLWADKYICWLWNRAGCQAWDQALWTTAHQDWGYNLPGPKKSGIKERLIITKAANSPYTHSKNCKQLLITLKESRKEDQWLYSMGAWVSGTDPSGKFFLKVLPPNKT